MHAGHLFHDLLFGTEDVGIILGEAPYPHQAVQGTGRLVAVAGAELGHAQRQIAVGFQALVEDLHVARAVHRLDGVLAVLGLGGEHGLGVFLPVT